MTPDFNIRLYQPADLPGLRDLILPIQQQEFGVPITWEDQPDLHDIPAYYRRGAGEFWAAVAGHEVIGTIALIDIGQNIGVIRKMFVVADWRGKDRGVAQQLLDALLAHARSCGMKDIYLGTTEKYHAAHRLYERNGFTVIDAAQLPDKFPRMAVDMRFYQRNLVV